MFIIRNEMSGRSAPTKRIKFRMCGPSLRLYSLERSQFSQMCWSIEQFHARYVHLCAIDYATFQNSHLMVGIPMIEETVMVAVDEYLKTFARHSDADFEWLASLEWKHSASLFILFVKSAGKTEQRIE